MTNSGNIETFLSNTERTGGRTTTKIFLIRSIDVNKNDNNNKILSCLNSTNPETIILNLNENKNKKRSLSKMTNHTTDNKSKIQNSKRRKADLICVICGGNASGYNFNQISCESCKAFFRRNALHSIDKTKCLSSTNNTNEILCLIDYNVKNKCQRCRLLKCFQSEEYLFIKEIKKSCMRKDFISTPEEKRLKQQSLEENRRLRLTVTNDIVNYTKSNAIEETFNLHNKSESTNPMLSCFLTEMDWHCLHHIKNAFLSASQSIPSASSVISFELGPDVMSAYMNTLDIQEFTAIKLINFIRKIPEFEQLVEDDRLTLVKYNLTLLFIIERGLTFDATRELCYDDNIHNSVSPAAEAFAHQCKSLFILCYGYELNRAFVSLLHKIRNIVDNDPTIVQLIMLTMIFLKGLSANDDQEPLLNCTQNVFYGHLKYTDLLFRYLVQRLSFDAAVIKMMQIVQVLIQIQRLTRDFTQCIKTKVDANYVNPLMKSLLHFT